MSSVLSFGQSLRHLLPIALKQVDDGLASLYRITKYLESIAHKEESLAKDILSMSSKDASKAKDDTDAMINYCDSWSAVRDVIEMRASNSVTYASELLNLVVDPLLSFHRNARYRLKELKKEQKHIFSKLNTSRNTLMKSKNTCHNLFESFKHQEIPHTRSSLQKLFSKNPHPKDTSALKEQVHMAFVNYEAAVAFTNAAEKSLWELELPSILDGLQTIEEERLTILQDHLKFLVSLQEQRTLPKTQVDIARDLLTALSPQRSLQRSIDNWYQKY